MGQKPISPLRHRKACVNSVISTHEWSQFRTGVATDSSLEGTGFELSVPLLRGSSGRCQSETAARKAERLKGSGPRRRCLPAAGPVVPSRWVAASTHVARWRWRKRGRAAGHDGSRPLCQRRRQIASAGRSKNASPDGWEKTGRGCAVLVRDALPQTQLSSSINEPASPSRPGITLSTARSVGDGRSGATRSSASMASTGPSPQRAPWQTGRQPGFTSGAGVACSV